MNWTKIKCFFGFHNWIVIRWFDGKDDEAFALDLDMCGNCGCGAIRRVKAKKSFDFDFDNREPRCIWIFRSKSCGYNGSYGTCNKTLSECRTLNNSEHFGGFPGLGKGD